MSNSPTKTPLPARAIASVVLACLSLFLFRVYGQVHWLPSHLTKEEDGAFHHVLLLTSPIMSELGVLYWVVALLALIWCVWSWRVESRAAAVTATVFSVIAMFAAVFIIV
jgi:hypothetical protein